MPTNDVAIVICKGHSNVRISTAAYQCSLDLKAFRVTPAFKKATAKPSKSNPVARKAIAYITEKIS